MSTSNADLREPEIIVNGRRLTPAQATTVRVALTSAEFECGDDELGRQMQEGYRARKREVLAIMLRGI